MGVRKGTGALRYHLGVRGSSRPTPRVLGSWESGWWTGGRTTYAFSKLQRKDVLPAFKELTRTRSMDNSTDPERLGRLGGKVEGVLGWAGGAGGTEYGFQRS